MHVNALALTPYNVSDLNTTKQMPSNQYFENKNGIFNLYKVITVDLSLV